jgi:predicted small lipoprotein YifL
MLMTFRTCLLLTSLWFTTACGISGPLEPAPPLWGPDRAAHEAQQAKKEADKKAADAARAAQTPQPVPPPQK